MEPDVYNKVPNEATPGEIALTSIAISMRRIADAITGDEHNLSLVNAITVAITEGILQAKRMS